ncbi:MAG TPA: DUF167 domain-containing protein [Acidobacteriota bacterium]|nr:DUF167 domain-containing protein [Acidobacteriota bacterium]
MRFQVHVAPKSRKNAVEVERGGGAGMRRIRVRVTAAPEGGQANDAVIEILAEALDLAKRSLRVAGGAASRVKWIEADGLEEAELWARLERLEAE